MIRTDWKVRQWRRRIELACVIIVVACNGACTDRSAPINEVVLYFSADDYVARPVIEAFEERTGITVRALGDTEATKTTGLVQRLRTEAASPRADVFWSSEVFLTIRLAQEGIFAPITTETDDPRSPSGLVGADRLWHGFALRARVVVFNADHVAASDAPRTMHDLLDERWRDRIVMARPQFGTTRGHMAMLVNQWGADGAREWLAALEANGVRLLDGNASVVRAVANGEALIGLTDTDDVWSGHRNGWPIDLTYVRHDIGDRLIGPMLIPNTVGVVRGGPNPEAAQRLAEFLLSPEVERLLAQSDSHNIPTLPAVAAEYPEYAVTDASAISFVGVADSMDEAMRICDEILR